MARCRNNPNENVRLLAGLMAVLALLIQLVLPSLVHASALSSGEMIEICSEAGPVLVRLDSDVTPGAPVSHEACPNCQSCAICVAGNLIVGGKNHIHSKKIFVTQIVRWNVSQVEQTSNVLKIPMTRGPPIGPSIEFDHVFHVFPVLSSNKGVAL